MQFDLAGDRMTGMVAFIADGHDALKWIHLDRNRCCVNHFELFSSSGSERAHRQPGRESKGKLAMKSRMILTVVIMAGTLLAQGPGGPNGARRFGGPGGPMAGGMAGGGAALANADALKTALGLTDAQVQQLRDLRKLQADAAKPIMDEIRGKRQAVADAMKSATPDSTLIGQLMVDIRKLNDSLKGLRADREAKALAILTPDQKTKLTALQDAQKLMPAVAQATALGLLAPPQGAAGRRMPGPMGQRGAARAGQPQLQ
jgi:Spy/CpxP family protein refolding chaperone